VFSPYYAWSKSRDPENHCAINVALYRAGADRWAMTERGRASLKRETTAITVGPSVMCWRDDALEIAIEEWTAPMPTRLRGKITVRPDALAEGSYALDSVGSHHWRPIAPRARIEVAFEAPALAWRGDAYLDCNWGEEPLEAGFRSWDWSRAHTRFDSTVYYDVLQRDGAMRALALRFDQHGAAHAIEPPPRVALPSTFWRVPRTGRAAPQTNLRVVRTLEDAPFYARSALAGDIDGEAADLVHESLSLDRFAMPVVRAMLPFRMPRIVARR
jgi:carotenoid 1,2-hydratase